MRSSFWAACFIALVLLAGCGASRDSLSGKTIRVMSYNIHHGIGTDSTFDIKRIANVIQRYDADIIALQDVDRWTFRTGKIDMITRLADLTGMTYTFAKSSNVDGGEHGNGFLTRFPILEEKPLLYHLQLVNQECSLMRLVLDVRGTEIVLMNTELNGTENDSVQNANAAEIRASAEEYSNVPIILCGSLNSPPESRSIAAITRDLTDCWTIAGVGEGFTFPSNAPGDRFDYIFVSKPRVPTNSRSLEVSLKPVEVRVLPSNASNHLPVLVTLKVVSE